MIASPSIENATKRLSELTNDELLVMEKDILDNYVMNKADEDKDITELYDALQAELYKRNI